MANEDDIIRDICLAREEAERHERTMKRDLQKWKEAVAEKDQQLNQKNLLIAELERKLTEATKE